MTTTQIDRARIEHIAKLASLSLQEEEFEPLARDLQAIIAHVEELNRLDTREVPPTANGSDAPSHWREDAIRPSLSHEEALKQAPHRDQGAFTVPAFVEM